MTVDLDEYRRRCVSIDQFAIQEEYALVPADMAFWSDQHADTYRAWQLCKLEREKEWGSAQLRARQKLGARGGKAPTVGEVEAEALQDAPYTELRRQEIYLETETKRLQGLLEALRTKREMLISLGAHLRQEYWQDPAIKEKKQ